MTTAGALRTASDDRRLTFVLPGTWASIPLTSEAASNAAITRVLKERIPRRDEFASVRRETRELLRGIATSAREVDAVFLALSLEIVPGVPFSSSIAATYADARDPGLPADADDATRLQAAFPRGALLELGGRPAVRTVQVTPEGSDGQPTTTVDLVYAVPTPDADRRLEIVADIPTEIDPDLVLELFDVLVGSIRWVPVDPDEHSP